MEFLSRTELILGKENIIKLANSKVAIFGIGGVGSYAVEGIARCGVGKFILVDGDVVEHSNLNRQLIALNSTIGMPKVEVAKQRILDINPDAEIDARHIYFDANSQFDFNGIDFIVDAIDSVTSKLLLVEKAKEYNIPIISSMGTGNKLDATQFKITDISKTKVCPLARVMRKELKTRNISDVPVIYSEEEPIKTEISVDYLKASGKRQIPASVSFVPSVAGLLIAQYVVKNLIK